MFKKLSKVSTRKLIALLLTVVYCALMLIGRIPATDMTPVYTMVLGFYFGRSTALDIPGQKKGDYNE